MSYRNILVYLVTFFIFFLFYLWIIYTSVCKTDLNKPFMMADYTKNSRLEFTNPQMNLCRYGETSYSLPLSAIGVEGVGGNGILIFSLKRWSPQGSGNFCTVCSTLVHIWRRFSGLGFLIRLLETTKELLDWTYGWGWC